MNKIYVISEGVKQALIQIRSNENVEDQQRFNAQLEEDAKEFILNSKSSLAKRKEIITNLEKREIPQQEQKAKKDQQF